MHIIGYSPTTAAVLLSPAGVFIFSIIWERAEVASWCHSWTIPSEQLDWRCSWFVWPETCTAWPTALGRCPGSQASCLKPFTPCCGRCQLPQRCLLLSQVQKERACPQSLLFFFLKQASHSQLNSVVEEVCLSPPSRAARLQIISCSPAFWDLNPDLAIYFNHAKYSLPLISGLMCSRSFLWSAQKVTCLIW